MSLQPGVIAVVRERTWFWLYKHKEDEDSVGMRACDAGVRVLLGEESYGDFDALFMTGPYAGQYGGFEARELRPITALEQLAECAGTAE